MMRKGARSATTAGGQGRHEIEQGGLRDGNGHRCLVQHRRRGIEVRTDGLHGGVDQTAWDKAVGEHHIDGLGHTPCE